MLALFAKEMSPKGPGSIPTPTAKGSFMIIELRSAEGGKHSDYIVEQQLVIYLKLCSKRDL